MKYKPVQWNPAWFADLDDLPTVFVPPVDEFDKPLPVPPDNASLAEVEAYWCQPQEYIVEFTDLKQGEWREPRIEGFVTLVKSLKEMGVNPAFTMYTLVVRKETETLAEAQRISIDGNHRRVIFPKYGITSWRSHVVFVNKMSQIPAAHLRTFAAGANAMHSTYSIMPTEYEILNAVRKARDSIKTATGKQRGMMVTQQVGKYFKDFTYAKYEHYQQLINVSIVFITLTFL